MKELKKIKKTLLGLVILGPFLGAVLLYRYLESPPLPKLGRLTSFHFIDQGGRFFYSQRLEGKVWVADFFYSTCHTSCPLQTAFMSELQRQWKGRDDFNLVSFTLDPKNDNPKALSKYALDYQADTSKWFFLTGDKGDLYDLAKDQFKIPAQEDDSGGTPDFIHSTKLVLVDRLGNIRGYYNVMKTAELDQLKSDLGRLLVSKD